MSFIRNKNVALLNLRKGRVALSILRKCRVALSKGPCRMSLMVKKGYVALSILRVRTPTQRHSISDMLKLNQHMWRHEVFLNSTGRHEFLKIRQGDITTSYDITYNRHVTWGHPPPPPPPGDPQTPPPPQRSTLYPINLSSSSVI